MHNGAAKTSTGDFGEPDTSAPSDASGDNFTAASSLVLPVMEEVACVEKVVVDQGGYRIVKTVETHQQLVDESLVNCTVEIERRPVGLQLAGLPTPEARYEGDTFIVPVIEEILVTEKRLVLVEEVRITRIHGTHRAPQNVSLRKEKIDVERLAADTSCQAHKAKVSTARTGHARRPHEFSFAWNV